MFSGCPGVGVLMARYSERLSMEMEAPPYPLVSLNGDSKGAPTSKGTDGLGRRAQVNSSKSRLTRSPLALRWPARVKNNKVPSADKVGRYSPSRVATSDRMCGIGASGWALNCCRKRSSGRMPSTWGTRLASRGVCGRPVKCSHRRKRSNQVMAAV